MEKADITKKIHLALVALIFYIQKGTAFSTSPSALTSCASSTANINYNFRIDAGETIVGTRTWFFGAGKIAESDGTTLTPVPSYSSRLTAYGTSGISLSDITVADAGTYIYVIVLLPTGSPFTATTSLSVQVAPLASPSGCQVSSLNQPGNIPTCTVNTNSGNCGTPSLIAFLVNSTNTSSQFICNIGETYQCCATSAALTCYSGSSNDFCKQFNCIGTTTTTTIAVTSSFLFSTSMISTSSSATTDNTLTVLPPNDTNNTSTKRSPTITGSTVSVTSSTSASTSSTAVSHDNNTSNVSTSENPTTAEPTAITKTSTDNNGTKSNISDTDIKVIVPAVVVPCGLLIIVAIVLVIFCVRRKAGKNVRESPDGMAIEDKDNNIDGWKQSLGQGYIPIIYPGPAAISTVATVQHSRPYPDTYVNQTVYFSSTYKSVRIYAQKGKTYEGHQPVPNLMATSRRAYELTVCYPQTGYNGQIVTKSKTNNSGHRTFHTSTQYKVEPKTINKQTDDRKQPVPPVNTGFEDTPTFRQLPQPPQNGKSKDQSLRGRSATIDDTPGLANETSRNNILPPLPLKQETVQEENASEKHKKKRKKKKKKDQMNVEIPEEENGETIV